MIKQLLLLSMSIFFTTSLAFAQKGAHLKKGLWSAKLQLNDTTSLPFRLEIAGNKNAPIFIIHNAEEQIRLRDMIIVSDSFQIDFPHFHSYLRFTLHSKKKIAGYWVNLNRGNNYQIAFEATLGSAKNKQALSQVDIDGKWKTTFDPTSKNPELALGVFTSTAKNLTGTFLTETGDYRFLEGTSCSNSFYLSCFDGSHAFLFTGEYKDQQLSGSFYSGKHYKTTWIAERDESFILRDPDSITYVKPNEPFTFKFKDLQGNDFSFPSEAFRNKVTIIQIMGTWCPNCLDETRYFKGLYEKYHAAGLEIISVAYETPRIFEEQVEKVELLKSRMNLTHTFLVGGQASKSLSSEHFSMLNEIISYPTAIFINRSGQVVKVHTGFNGPGTGDIYTTYSKETEAFIQLLLEQ